MITKENIYTYTNNYEMKWYEVDSQRILKPASLLNHLQDIATKSADNFGIGMDFLYPLNYAWYLIKYHMEFSDYPQDIKEITIRTESRGSSRLFASRDFEIWDEDRFLGRITSQWAMINRENKNFVKMSEIDRIPPYEKREDDLNFPKITPQESYDIEKTFEIRYDDIDINQHVNNSNYIIWAFEPLDMSFRKNHKLKTLDIIYKKEITYGQEVVSMLKIDGAKTYHILLNKDTQEQLCIIEAVWQKLNICNKNF